VARRRLDELLVQRKLCATRDEAMRRVMAGEVLVGDRPAVTPGVLVDTGVDLRLKRRRRYVGRGGIKLEAALRAFDLRLEGKVVADVGASTGGFTDCSLQHGAERVYAIDVATGALDWSLRSDPRVVVMEGTNAMHLRSLPEPVDLVTMDLSFTSLRRVLPRAANWLRSEGVAVPLIKPQYEATRSVQLVRGVVVDAEERRSIVSGLLQWAQSEGWRIGGLVPSPIRGSGGNWEYLALLSRAKAGALRSPSEIEGLVRESIPG
jgi:23S rRNA (cytidine1920-2'-O)/16S rRNA (cytidine1409-2'-O)-methyltransferase